VSHRRAYLRDMGEGYFNPWRDASERACATCRYSSGMPDGHHLWCEKHRHVVVFPCGWWERAAGADVGEEGPRTANNLRIPCARIQADGEQRTLGTRR
jgi:hypothetical protein